MDYLLSCKCFCGYCGAMLNAEAGTSKTGKVYHYYKCGDKKRGKKCEMKAVPQERLEDAVILATVHDMLTDDMIGKLTVRVLEVQEQELADDPVNALRRRLDSVRKRQRNLLDAIEEGGARGPGLSFERPGGRGGGSGRRDRAGRNKKAPTHS